MDKCPVTGMLCSNPKVIHITDVGPNYEATQVVHLCQICGMNKVEQQQAPPPPQPKLPTFVKGLFDLLTAAMQQKMVQQQKHIQQEPPPKPPCPSCGTTLQDIAKTSRLGCQICYEHFRHELLPVFIHAHKATEHIGKKPKRGPELPISEQISLLELQLKQAVEQEQYERANEIKKKLEELRG